MPFENTVSSSPRNFVVCLKFCFPLFSSNDTRCSNDDDRNWYESMNLTLPLVAVEQKANPAYPGFYNRGGSRRGTWPGGLGT